MKSIIWLSMAIILLVGASVWMCIELTDRIEKLENIVMKSEKLEERVKALEWRKDLYHRSQVFFPGDTIVFKPSKEINIKNNNGDINLK